MRYRHVALFVGADLRTAEEYYAALFGMEVWIAFLESAQKARILLEQGLVGFDKMQSVFAAVRLLGGPVWLGYAVHAAVALPAIAVTVWLWRRDVPFALRAAAVAPTALLITPFFLDYDLLLLALTVGWLVRDGLARRFLDWEVSLFLFVWLWPGLARRMGMIGVPLTPLVLAGILWLILRRARDAEGART